MSASLNTVVGLMNSVMSQPIDELLWPLFARWLKTCVSFVTMGFVMEIIEDRVVWLAHIFWKAGYKESNPLTTQASDDLRKRLKVVKACIAKIEEKVATRQQKVLL
uniref:Uncharacterized protein n=1 Tax=Nelumbo nucifera TaxID=4432 RepID=A0A822YSF8_NELNU|nr:TPA_asm: hypothetical protein HUJ06_007735 [Nelumbo nucifera]